MADLSITRLLVEPVLARARIGLFRMVECR